MSGEKLWGGRFSKKTDTLMEQFNASIGFDSVLWPYEVKINTVYAGLCVPAGILTEEEAGQIKSALRTIGEEFAAGTFTVKPADEDIHTAVERRLKELTGEAGAKLYAGKSRNDVIVTEEMMYVKDAAKELSGLITKLQEAVIACTEDNVTAVMPGYTHMRQGQPVLFAHYILALACSLQRDKSRLNDLCGRLTVLPLGAGAFAGSSHRIDLEKAAAELGFASACGNSIDSVSSRDFFIEYLGILSIITANLSRYAEDFIIFSTPEFGFIEIDDAYCTGSSIMPQKKNPDALELIRAQAGVVHGCLSALLAVVKGAPLTYSKDLQEDKQPVFKANNIAQTVIQLFSGIIGTMKIKTDAMSRGIDWTVYATDLADYLVRNGISFRTAHRITGEIVRYCLDEGLEFSTLPLERYKKFSPQIKEDIYPLFKPESSIACRNLPGGTSPGRVNEQLNELKKKL